jgi:hypothetical protein
MTTNLIILAYVGIAHIIFLVATYFNNKSSINVAYKNFNSSIYVNSLLWVLILSAGLIIGTYGALCYVIFGALHYLEKYYEYCRSWFYLGMSIDVHQFIFKNDKKSR